ncbi:hypothetical protein CC1G_02615 [Coprinopsis cinerea okayama7|uniref:Uncharacterized protein n=1 Tax=Coprinopsis cinerea (strain Okayama-7 / 130 / ATCC MYA-4618 / FGSC 9003) TaxID=240176 RepID=A8PBC8_COPC7|nr:hypothetical protein CC1G_02615 [Coprinopsis cinerea okayama7\|eukprot:XP_001840152.2 hypothetical protein CC1G_02615 [Coprinopsis cinerea okayama7\
MEKWWYKDDPTEKKARNVLPEKTRRIFEGKQIVCVEYQNITENDERDIFKRVQLGMALTPAEKLQVINTPRAAFIRDLQNEHVKDGGLSSAYLEWDSSRGGDFRCLAQALWCIEKYGPNLKNAGSISQLEKWLTSETELDEDFEEKATDTYRIFSELVQDPKLGKVFKKPTKVSPIEFILISLLIAVHRTSLSMGQLSSAIGTMRTLVRKEHVDIRMNNRVAKTMLDYIRTVKRSDFDQDSEPVAAAPAKGKGKTKAPAKPKSKRKRESGSNNESDEDYAEGPAKAKPKKSKPAPTPKKVPPPPPMKKEPPPSFPSLPSSSGSSRLAALRETARVSTPPSLPSLPTTSQTRQSSVSSNPPTPQLPSPGQRFTFPSSLSAVTGPQSHSVLQGQMQQQPYYSQQQPQHSPYTYNPTGGSGSTATANGYPAATRYVTGGQPPPNPPSRGNSYSGSGNWGSWR